MKFTQQAVINAPVEQVDLEDWLFTLSDSDYQATAKGHKAAGTVTTDGVRGMVNVESIGNVLIVQHYLKVKADSTHVEMLSERSHAYLAHLIPTSVWVRWTMTASARTEDTTNFSCTVETEMAAWIRFAAAASAFWLLFAQARRRGSVGFRRRHHPQAAGPGAMAVNCPEIA
jgi:hypothetical protein